MAIKVIKKGKSQKSFRGTCRNCKAIFTFTSSDAKYTPGGPRPDDGDFYSINCPECKQTVIVYP